MVQLNKKVSVAISNIIDINDKIRESLFNEPNIDTVTDATASYKRHQALYVPLMRVFDELTFKDIISIEAVMIVGKNGLEYYNNGTMSDEEIYAEELCTLKSYEDNQENREAAICYMTEKTFVLSDYLHNGVQILNIDLN